MIIGRTFPIIELYRFEFRLNWAIAAALEKPPAN
jgi:hypothetical protein